MEQLLGGVHLSLSNNSQHGIYNNNNNPAGGQKSNVSVEGEGIDEEGEGESANWEGEEVEEEADV